MLAQAWRRKRGGASAVAKACWCERVKIFETLVLTAQISRKMLQEECLECLESFVLCIMNVDKLFEVEYRSRFI